MTAQKKQEQKKAWIVGLIFSESAEDLTAIEVQASSYDEAWMEAERLTGQQACGADLAHL